MKNINLLQRSGYKLSFSDPSFNILEYAAVSVQIPSLTATESQSSFRGLNVYTPGDTLIYEPFTIRFAVDEEMTVYDVLAGWMKYNHKNAQKEVDITLSLLTSHNNVTRNFVFKNVFITALGGFDIDIQQTEVEYAYLDVTFRYDSFSY